MTQATPPSTASYRVLGLGLLLIVAGLAVLFYSASDITLACAADDDPRPWALLSPHAHTYIETNACPLKNKPAGGVVSG